MSRGTQKPVQFGIRLPVAGLLASPKAIARVAREPEKLGCDVVWVNDFIAWTTYQYSTHVSSGSVEGAGPGGRAHVFRPLTTLGSVAGVTENARLERRARRVRSGPRPQRDPCYQLGGWNEGLQHALASIQPPPTAVLYLSADLPSSGLRTSSSPSTQLPIRS
jgi:hypothetical protein